MQVFSFQRPDKLPLRMDYGEFPTRESSFFGTDPHQVSYFELMFFEQIQGSLTLDNQSISLNPHTILCTSPYQIRSWKVDREKVKGFYITFEKDFLDAFFEDRLFVYRLHYFYNPNFLSHLQAQPTTLENFGCILEEIRKEARIYNNFSEHIIRSWLYLLLVQLNRAFAAEYQVSEDDRTNQVAFEFRRLVEENVHDLHSVDEMAQKIGISRISLNKRIKQQFNLTASDFLKERQIVEIKKYLIHSELTIAEIAFRLNFSEPSNMMRAFKRRTGFTPTEFRRGYQIDSTLTRMIA